jgi:tRNA(Ile)-lysidine synthase
VQLGDRLDDTGSSDLGRTVSTTLDRRLLPGGARPIAVALSGGGDSLALLLAAADWGRVTGRKLLVLTVDHGLRPQSADWTRSCAATATRLGLPFHALTWEGDKPTTGLPAAARAARHRLLADAARTAGARVILLGHTADDVLEARRMRAEGATTPEPREWTPSPAWPQGRGLFLLRPLLTTRRAAIRDWLTARGEAWIEDPANADLAYARPRARRAIAREGGDLTPPAPEPAAAGLALAVRMDESGGFALPRRSLRDAEPAAARRFTAVACLCAAGTDRAPARARTQRLADRLRDVETFAASLAGARIEADENEVRVMREPGEASRGGLAAIRLEAEQTTVWDGRFEITAGDRPTEVRALAGLASQLDAHDRGYLTRLPPKARATLPVLIDATGALTRPVVIRPLTEERLLIACGAIDREPE